MGKILDGFMKKHDLDDATVLALMGEAYLQIVDPEYVYTSTKEKGVPERIREEAKQRIGECAAASLEAFMMGFMGGESV